MRLTAMTVLSVGLLVGCAPASVDVSFEQDGVEIVELDEDGVPPVQEVFYEEGGWRIDTECNADIEPTGNGIGDITGPTELLNQYGEVVNIHDFCGRAILIVTGAFW